MKPPVALRAWRSLPGLPRWAWASAGGVLLAPWILRYFLWVLGQGCEVVLPRVGGP